VDLKFLGGNMQEGGGKNKIKQGRINSAQGFWHGRGRQKKRDT